MENLEVELATFLANRRSEMDLVNKFRRCKIGQLFELYDGNNSNVLTMSSIFVFEDFGSPLDRYLCKFLAANTTMGGFATILFQASQLPEYRPDDFHLLLHLNKFLGFFANTFRHRFDVSAETRKAFELIRHCVRTVVGCLKRKRKAVRNGAGNYTQAERNTIVRAFTFNDM